MAFECTVEAPNQPQKLDILCLREGDAYRIYVWPTWLPPHIAKCLDSQGEAYPVEIDVEDLHRRMTAQGLQYEKREMPHNSYGFTAEGPAAAVLMLWLSRAFESGTQSILVGHD